MYWSLALAQAGAHTGPDAFLREESERFQTQIREFIKTPERIADYYPGAKSTGTCDQPNFFYVKGKSGVSLFEVTADSDELVSLRVWTARPFDGPYDIPSIQKRAFFIMDEDWHLEDDNGKTRLTKVWLNLQKRAMKLMPMGLIVRLSIPSEAKLMISRWEQAASLASSFG